MMANSLIMAVGIVVGKIVISIISAFAIFYFRFPLRMFFFWVIFLGLMLPVEVRILPTYKVVTDLGLLNTYTGLTLPLIASATATFLFRQFFLTVPNELFEAARVDRAGPMRFFLTIMLLLSRTNIAALTVILFVYGWNQYLLKFIQSITWSCWAPTHWSTATSVKTKPCQPSDCPMCTPSKSILIYRSVPLLKNCICSIKKTAAASGNNP